MERTTNKLKLIIICILMYISILLTVQTSRAQGPPNGWPTGGNGNGGPPPPPPTYCDANPGDPSCNGLSTPIDQGDWLLVLVALIGGTYIITKKKVSYDK